MGRDPSISTVTFRMAAAVAAPVVLPALVEAGPEDSPEGVDPTDVSEPVDPLLVEQNIIRASAKEIDTRCRLGLCTLRPSGLGRTSQTP